MDKSVFDFEDYKAFISNWIRSGEGKKKRGQLSQMAEYARIHKTTFSQILRGPRQLSLEQAELLARFMRMDERESEFFVLLVNMERAGTAQLREIFVRQRDAIRRSREQLAGRVTRSQVLSAAQSAIFYSSWIYSAARNLSAIPGYNHLSAIADRLRIPPKRLEPVIAFLLEHGLCVQGAGGIALGPQMTHLEAGSPLVSRHHGNWRVKAMERHPMLSDAEELAYSSPVSLSSEDIKNIRQMLMNLVQRANELIKPSPSERLFCLNLDWFEVF